MRITPIRDLLARHPVFRTWDSEDIDLLAGCARNEVVDRGELLAMEGGEADRFFLIREGLVAHELHAPGGTLTVDTATDGELVGWAWIFPPFRWTNDVRAVERTRLVTVEAACLRDKADADPAFGYRAMQHFAAVLVGQLDATRLRLLDVYGSS